MENRRNVLVRIGLLVLCAASLVACGDDDGETGAGSGAFDLAAFCAEAPDADAEVPESYVGSSDHVKDLRDLREVAPTELHDDLDLVIEHFEDDVDPSDLDSQLTENFPTGVNAAVERVIAYIDAECAS